MLRKLQYHIDCGLRSKVFFSHEWNIWASKVECLDISFINLEMYLLKCDLCNNSLSCKQQKYNSILFLTQREFIDSHYREYQKYSELKQRLQKDCQASCLSSLPPSLRFSLISFLSFIFFSLSFSTIIFLHFSVLIALLSHSNRLSPHL